MIFAVYLGHGKFNPVAVLFSSKTGFGKGHVHVDDEYAPIKV